MPVLGTVFFGGDGELAGEPLSEQSWITDSGKLIRTSERRDVHKLIQIFSVKSSCSESSPMINVHGQKIVSLEQELKPRNKL